MFYSIITPTYNRPQEVKELLDSLLDQEYKNFEMIIADNSPDDSLRKVVTPYQDKMRLIYLYENGLGVSEARNLGSQYATGDYVIFIDSDCILPSGYLQVVDAYLKKHKVDAYGGPDRAHKSFTNKQKAINYAMTSYYTTGGIRGGKSQLGSYHPRSFNMGVKREVFNKVKGFSKLRVSEDIDLSIRLYKSKYNIALINDAYVFHKRRATFRKFFRQVYAFGMGRYNLQKVHGNAVKPVHMLPSMFVIYLVAGAIISFFSTSVLIFWLGSLFAYTVLLFTDSIEKTRSFKVGLLSIYATFNMLIGYGSGMLQAILSKSKNK